MRDGRDAQVILEAVRLNILPLIKRRLLASERDEIQSGHIYVWEEAQDDGGLLRWTDGRRWWIKIISIVLKFLTYYYHSR